jgi:hypothetical protein
MDEEDKEETTVGSMLSAGCDSAVARVLASWNTFNVADCDAPMMLWCIMLARMETMPAQVNVLMLCLDRSCMPQTVLAADVVASS